MENSLEASIHAENHFHDPSAGSRFKITPKWTFSITAIISANFCGFYFLSQLGVNFPILLQPFMWMAMILAFLTLLFLIPLLAVATLADLLTKRFRRAGVAFLSMSIGVGTIALMMYALNTMETTELKVDYVGRRTVVTAECDWLAR